MTEAAELTRRTRAVESIQYLARALERAEAAAFARTQGLLEPAREFARAARDILAEVAWHEDVRAGGMELDGTRLGGVPPGRGAGEHPGGIWAVVVAGPNRGLAGTLGAELLAEADRTISVLAGRNHNVAVAVAGNIVLRHFEEGGRELLVGMPAPDGRDAARAARAVAGAIWKLRENRGLAGVTVVQTRFENILEQRAEVEEVLPAPGRGSGGQEDWIFAGDPGEVLLESEYACVLAAVHLALLESRVSESAARMRTMGTAAEGAGEMLEELEARRRLLRQSAITRELIEIVESAEIVTRAGTGAFGGGAGIDGRDGRGRGT